MPRQLERLRAALAAKYPKAQIVAISARTGEGTEAGTSTMLDGEMDLREAPDVDYEVYAEGEALLGWLNAAARIESTKPSTAMRFCGRIADDIQARLANERRRNRSSEDDAFAG